MYQEEKYYCQMPQVMVVPVYSYTVMNFQVSSRMTEHNKVNNRTSPEHFFHLISLYFIYNMLTGFEPGRAIGQSSSKFKMSRQKAVEG